MPTAPRSMTPRPSRVCSECPRRDRHLPGFRQRGRWLFGVAAAIVGDAMRAAQGGDGGGVDVWPSVRRCACVRRRTSRGAASTTRPTRKCLSEVSPKYDHCSFAGTCNNGTCVCDGSHTGLDCRQLRCPRMCAGSSHGKCNEDGTCACVAGWGGDDCTMAVCQTPPCVWSWGLNSAGQLGHTDATTMPEVTPASASTHFR